jgi:hypothetical protein
MNTARFISLLRQSSEPDRSDVGAIKEVIREFPFFYPAYALLARIMKTQVSIGYEKALSLASVYAPDRTRLHEFIHAVPEPKEPVIAPSYLPDSSKEKQPRFNQQPVVEPETKFDRINPEPETVTNDDEPITEKKHRLVSIIEQRLAELENSSAEEPATINIKKREFTELKTNAPPAELANDIQQPSKTEVMTFTGWLKHLSENKIEALKTKCVGVQPVSHAADKSLISFKEKKQAEEVSSTDTKALIDKFIAEEPRISPARPGFYNASNAARQSVEDHDDIASPTLASIYLMQGNKEKAIEVYKRLMLHYPEKSHFFAAQIEKIQHP